MVSTHPGPQPLATRSKSKTELKGFGKVKQVIILFTLIPERQKVLYVKALWTQSDESSEGGAVFNEERDVLNRCKITSGHS